MRSNLFFSLLLLPICMTAGARADDAVPDPVLVRHQIDDLIGRAPGHRATLGTLCGAITLSISYGAPAWNAADHDGCAVFYVKTGQSLCDAFGGTDQATDPAKKVLTQMKSVLDRVRKSNDSDANAWAMRFTFDKAAALADVEGARAARMLALGMDTMNRSQFEDSADAFTEATTALRELDGQPLDNIPLECRYSPQALSDALFGQKRYQQAAAAAEEALRFMPDLPDQSMDLSKHFADPAIYRLLSESLQDAASKDPHDPALQLLAGYHLFFTGHQETAKPFFEKVLELDPNDTAARRMLEQYDPAHHKAPAGGVRLPGQQA